MHRILCQILYLLFLVLLPLLVGCNRPVTLPASTLLLPPADEQVAESALRHAIAQYERDDRGLFAAYVLPRSDLSSRLVANLRDVSPLVTDCMNVSMDGGLAHERVSGIPVKLWMVRPLTLSPKTAPTRATAEVAWYQGIGDSRIFTLTLENRAGQWVVTAQKMETLIDPVSSPPSPQPPAETTAPTPPDPLPAPVSDAAALDAALASPP